MDLSILNSVKKLLGIDPLICAFDLDIIMHVNSVFIILYQMGVTDEPFSISDATTTWADYLGEADNLELIKTYVGAKVRQMFDPPSGAVAEALYKTIEELEWRISVEVDKGNGS